MTLHLSDLSRTSRLLLLTIILCISGCSLEQEQNEPEPTIRPVRYITLETSEVGQNRSFSGTAVSGRESALSFKVAGTIKTLQVKVGDSVTTGDLLAQLNPADFEVEYKSAVASLKTAEADAKAASTAVSTSRSNYQRIEKLYESDNVSLSEFEQARGEYDTARANLQAAQSRIATARSQLQAADNQLGYTSLRAPFDGIVNSVLIEENEEVSPGTTVLTLSGKGNLEVRVNLSDLYISRVEQGLKTQVSFPSLGKDIFEGMVREIPYATSDAPTYPVTIRILSADNRIRPGMAAKVVFSFTSGLEGAQLIIPPDAVGEDPEGNYVFVIEPGEDTIGIARKNPVELGSLTEQGFEVISGLSQGQLVATSGLQVLLDGMHVRLINDPIKNW